MASVQKHWNGVVSKKDPNQLTFKVTLTSGGGRPGGSSTLPCLPAVFRSTIPCLLFLFVYAINGSVRLLPRAADFHCVTLHNVSRIESLLFPFGPHRLVASVHSLALDALSAAPYLLHYLIPLLYPVYLHATGRFERTPRFLWLLGSSMWAHYLVWFLLPTAPPWLQDNMDRSLLPIGRGLNASGPPPVEILLRHREGCAFARLDRWTGLPFFYGIFSGNPVPFASFPSGHLAWPTCVLVTLPTARERRWFWGYVAWVAWATMYSCHHYLLDIVAAILLVAALDRAMLWLDKTRQQKRRYANALNSDCLLSVIER